MLQIRTDYESQYIRKSLRSVFRKSTEQNLACLIIFRKNIFYILPAIKIIMLLNLFLFHDNYHNGSREK